MRQRGSPGPQHVLVLLAGCPTPGSQNAHDNGEDHIRVSVRPPPGAASEPPALRARAALLRFGAPGAGCGRHLRAMQGARRGRLDRRMHGVPWRHCARSIFVGRSLACLRRVRAAPPSGRSVRAAVVPPYDRASARQPRPGSQGTGPADRAWCAGLRGLLAARVHGSAHPRPLIGTDPGSGKVECRRLGGSAADQPYGVVHAQADGGGCRFRSASWSPSPGAREAFPRRLW